jgi:ubiquinone/menaquinone biosynthesis C-methylase UbiE
MVLSIAKKLLKKLFRRPVDIQKSWAEEPAKYSDMVDYLNWFDQTSSLEDTAKRSIIDWKKSISNFDGYANLAKNKCLEIGFGGGRLLVPACQDFTEVSGVDIHNSFEKTREYLTLCQTKNYKLLNRKELPGLPDLSFDFIFTYIVFQHFNSFAEVDHYLEEIKRLLAPNGFCHIFYAKSDKPEIEEVDPHIFEIRRRSLFINPVFFRKHLEEKGFKIISFSDILLKNADLPHTKDNEILQARVLFQLK